jgi:hypothetical protein
MHTPAPMTVGLRTTDVTYPGGTEHIRAVLLALGETALDGVALFVAPGVEGGAGGRPRCRGRGGAPFWSSFAGMTALIPRLRK